jgi:hypothetical protein
VQGDYEFGVCDREWCQAGASQAIRQATGRDPLLIPLTDLGPDPLPADPDPMPAPYLHDTDHPEHVIVALAVAVAFLLVLIVVVYAVW